MQMNPSGHRDAHVDEKYQDASSILARSRARCSGRRSAGSEDTMRRAGEQYRRANTIVHFFLAFVLFGTPGVVMVILTLLKDPKDGWDISLPFLGAGLVIACTAAWFKERFWRFLKTLRFRRRTLVDRILGD